MRGHATGRGGIGWSKDHTKARAILNSLYGLPPFLGLDRGAGSWSRQTAPAVDGTTFITLGTAEDEPRWDYGGGLEGLLIEPTRTNIAPASNFVDAGVNNVPDGWVINQGVAGTDFDCVAGGPHGGLKFRIKDTNVAGRGCYDQPANPGAVTLVGSGLYRRTTTAGAASLRAFYDSVGHAWTNLSLGTTLTDWALFQTDPTAVGGCTDMGLLFAQDGTDPPGIIEGILPQIEVGDCASSRIPSAAGATTRAAELLTIDPSVVGRHRGAVLGLSRFDFPSTQALTVDPVICCWANGYKLVYDPADDKCKVVVAGTKRAASAALTFARQSWIGWRVDYGAAGQKLSLSLNGGAVAEYTDTTAWGDPGALAPYLGSDAASANCRSMAHARIESAWY